MSTPISFCSSFVYLNIYLQYCCLIQTDRKIAERASFDAYLSILALILLILTVFKIASAYIILIFALFPLLRDSLLVVVENVTGQEGWQLLPIDDNIRLNELFAIKQENSSEYLTGAVSRDSISI